MVITQQSGPLNTIDFAIAFNKEGQSSELLSSKVLLKYLDRLCSRYNIKFVVVEVGKEIDLAVVTDLIMNR